MKKLKLELESLEVETFQTAEKPEERGTVQGLGDSSGPVYECMYQCHGTDFGCGSDFGCDSDWGCASVHCSGWECNSLSGCVSYEVINCTA